MKKQLAKNDALGETILVKIKSIFLDAKNQLQMADGNSTKLPVVQIKVPEIQKQFKHRDHVVFVTNQELAKTPYLHPANGQYSYENYLTGIQAFNNGYSFLTSIFKDGSRG